MTARAKPSGWSRLSRHARGYGSAWGKIRAVVWARDRGLCQAHWRKRVVRFAHAVDHIVPRSQGGTDDESNLECLCEACHAEKTQREAAAAQGHAIAPRLGFTPDGSPIWPDED